MPRYRENPLIVKFSLLCPGISQNTKHHQLTLYKGQVWREKSYLDLCNHNVLNIVYSWSANFDSDRWPFEKNGKLYVPPVPGEGFIRGDTQIPWDSEILQSFAELTHITNITFHYLAQNYAEDSTHQINVGSYRCWDIFHKEQCVPPYTYYSLYIWTKEGLKIKQKISDFLTLFSLFPYFDPTPPSFHHEDPG